MKLRGIPIGKAKLKDGKLETVKTYRNVSQRIAAKKNPKRKYQPKGLTSS